MSLSPDIETRQRRVRDLFDQHHDFVWRSVRRLGIDPSEIDDVVQETFIIAGRKIDEFEGRSSITTWLFGIAMRVCRTHRRSRHRRIRKANAVAQAAEEQFDPYPRADAADLLVRLLDELDDDRRAAFILSDLEGMTAMDIAETFELNVNTVYSRIRSARRRVERALVRLDPERSRGGAA